MSDNPCVHDDTYTDEYGQERCETCGIPVSVVDVSCRGGCGRLVDVTECPEGTCPECRAREDRRNQEPPRWRA